MQYPFLISVEESAQIAIKKAEYFDGIETAIK
jgi:hypothetical protein